MSWIEDILGAATPCRDVWFESNGTRLYALEAGAGTIPIVFLHGGLADHRAALHSVAPLTAAHRLLTPDLRGSGRSHFHGELSWDQLADDVTTLLDHEGIERAVIGGTSMGSGVALRCALRHPQRTRGVILSAVVYPGEDRGLLPAQAAAMRSIGEAGEQVRAYGIEAIVPLFERLQTPVRERAIAMVRGFDPLSVAATARFLASSAQPLQSLTQLRAITAPVLLIPGNDPEHPPQLAQQYAEQLPNSRLAPDLAHIAEFCAGLP